VTILLDSGILYAYYDRSDRWHRAAVGLIGSERGSLLLPSSVIPEVDHLLGARLGRQARRAFHQGLVGASYLMVDIAQERVARITEIEAQFADLELGFVDCSIVALADSLGVRRVATTDRRHFEPLARAFGLELLPSTP
jgi:predicted nucleic acid-binding protein